MKYLESSLPRVPPLAILLLFARPAPAEAEGPVTEPAAGGTGIAGFELSVARTPQAPDCPNATELSASVERVGTSPASAEGEPENAPLVTQVVFDRDAEGYFAEVRATGKKSGVRVVRAAGETCAPLVESTTVVLAVLLDRLPESAEEPTPPAVPATPPAAASSAPPPPASRPKQTVVLAVGVAGGVAAGLIDHVPAGTLAAGFRPSYGRWELDAGALWAPTRSFAYSNGSVDVMLLAARLGGCGWVMPFGQRWGFGGCAGALLGSLSGAGHHFDREGSTSQFWPVAEAGLHGRVVLNKPLVLRLGVTGLLPLRHLTFSVDNVGVAYETPSGGVLLELGTELRFE